MPTQKNGFFSCADSLSYEFDETKEPVVKFGSSPQCNKMSRIFRGTDTLSMVTALGKCCYIKSSAKLLKIAVKILQN